MCGGEVVSSRASGFANMNDLQASELISKSLAGELSPLEREELERHLALTPPSQALANLSALIQKSLQDSSRMVADESTVESDERLADLSKERMRHSIAPPRGLRAVSVLQPSYKLLRQKQPTIVATQPLPSMVTVKPTLDSLYCERLAKVVWGPSGWLAMKGSSTMWP